MSTYNPNNSRRRQFERAQYEAKLRDTMAAERMRQHERFGRYVWTAAGVETAVRAAMKRYDER